MEFPHHHQHHRPDGRRDEYPPPSRPHGPPSFYGENEFDPPPPPFAADHYGPPPPPSMGFNYSDSISYPPPPPPQSTVQHVSHESESSHHHYRPHMPSFVHHRTHHQGSEPPIQKPSVRVYTKAKTDFSLTIREGKVILTPSDPSDPCQHWIKDEKYSIRVKDEEGFPSFALINKATGQAIKHSIGATHPVQLIPYNPDVLDESILWTQSKDLGDGFRAVRMVNNIRLNVDAYNGDKNHGGVHDGTVIVLWEWKKGDNQRWTIIPY